MFTVRNTGEHMYVVIQKDGSDKYILLGSTDQAQQICQALNAWHEIQQAYPSASNVMYVVRQHVESNVIPKIVHPVGEEMKQSGEEGADSMPFCPKCGGYHFGTDHWRL